MDFKRIQWIFLLIFVAIDVFLGLQWYQGIQFDTVQTIGPTSVLKEMQGDNITFKKPTTTSGDGFYIAGQDDDMLMSKIGELRGMSYMYNADDRELTTQLYNRKRFKIDLDRPQRVLDHYVNGSQNVINGQDYTYSSELTAMTNRQIVYVQSFPAGKVYDNSGEVRFKVDSDGYVTGYTQTYVNNAKILREKMATISEEKALTWLYQYNQVPNNTSIIWNKLAYAKLLDINNTTVYVPTWFFGMRSPSSQNVEVKRVNAFTGTLIKDVPKKVKVADTTESTADKEVFK